MLAADGGGSLVLCVVRARGRPPAARLSGVVAPVAAVCVARRLAWRELRLPCAQPVAKHGNVVGPLISRSGEEGRPARTG